jgi:acyl-CoA oxidase
VELILHEIRKLPAWARFVLVGQEDSYIPIIMSTQFQMPGSIHLGMFLNGIKFLGSDKQFQRYHQSCLDFSVLGCYAQTELGHGSDIQRLQTTAEYSPQEEAFYLHTPCVAATKWWPGELGLFANHALVFARLIVAGTDHGIEPFVVRIRDDRGQPLPGIELGDIGPKIGYNSKDNGYLIFDRVKIPREAMLNRYVKVHVDGRVEKRGNPRIMYATMMLIRKHISTSWPYLHGVAVATAAKYSLKRKQFMELGRELPVFEYQLQQHKVMPALVEHFVVLLVGHKIGLIAEKNYQLILQDDDSMMSETHCILCLAKVFASESCLAHLESLRLACGGHGYSHYSGIPNIYLELLPNVTFEGENTILLLQIAKILLKEYSRF